MTQEKPDPSCSAVPLHRGATQHTARRQIMFRCSAEPDRSRTQSREQDAKASLRLPAALLAVGLMTGAVTQPVHAAPVPAEPFKVASIHFETNASACDMGIQIRF